ncbi:MAG: DUF3995 domain-containing protein [Myxococcales bacterium]|nr:DUF3995 domain-containing protein [Myxococcales bacterium]
MSGWISLASLVFLACAHSYLGERLILVPLFRSPGWQVGIPRSGAQRVLRFAWHLTSIAWLGLGAVIVGAPVGLAVAAVSLASSLVVLLAMRAHLAWPVFLLGGLAALEAEGRLPELVRSGAVVAAVVVAVGAAALHVYWAAGGRWGLARAIPQTPDGAPRFRPGRLLTLAVAGLLGAFAALVLATAQGGAPTWVRLGTAGALLVLVVRAVGDGRMVGFSKRLRTTAFGRADDLVYTPLVVLMAVGAGMALVPA